MEGVTAQIARCLQERLYSASFYQRTLASMSPRRRHCWPAKSFRRGEEALAQATTGPGVR
ncbi:hypothetical protein LNQ03_03370 [Klebsiella pneumoniae subsp. pneumoniae]|nr:hypothetical protein [Klebsiella pneumoniae subsp. pneumoniae]